MDTSLSAENDCDICGGAGFVHPVENGMVRYDRTATCVCMERELAERRREYLLKSCQFPIGSEHMTIDNYKLGKDLQAGYNASVEMADNSGTPKWIALIGGNDTGKTHLGIAVCRKWVEAGIAARYTLVSLLLDELREGFRVNDGEGYAERFRYYCNIPLLLLDDLGIESKTAWVQEKLDTIIDYRLMNKLSLIVTSNTTLDDMQQRIRSRIIRHGDIYDMGTEEYSLSARRAIGK